ncbi:Alanine dehydrogenase [Flexibacter flexilis DSM 6793]|uniref:Saccharopine dehydrogenase [NAD(+), L-lysine-forming] n=1 Tax=Flexibacter flexilis DSM 6793 TaxID=927664 RepID=A0A1I1LSD8_9BACT|nr:NAD(P)-dependent oxidoreductase [Flexibacter flexilis]SFC75959.1 Alanine dehydrogenase [Flexibacter flexilis DSM 6793]
MNYLKLGLIREYKNPPDKRVALLPEQCLELQAQYPFLQVKVESSSIRCVPDDAYTQLGIEVGDDMSDCDLLLGIKEVPVDKLLSNKTYLFFSHTIKKQAHNRKLLQTVIKKNVKLVDYECLTNERGERIVAFGYYAGIVGAYNGIRGYGLRYSLFNLKPANQCHSMAEMISTEYPKVAALPAIKIALVGKGRVGKGAKDVLDGMNIKQVSPEEYLTQTFSEPVYTQISSADYYARKDGKTWDSQYFHQNPAQVYSTFERFAALTDILITTAFWHPSTPSLFSLEALKSTDFRIKVIADITCDIEGFVPCTLKASTITEPFFDYQPHTHSLTDAFSNENHVTLMSIDNLPCELPYDASRAFGRQLLDNVFPHLLVGHDSEKVVKRATIAEKNALTGYFEYLSDYIYSKKDE